MLLGDGKAGDLMGAVACPRIGSGCCRPLGDSPGKITFYRRKRAGQTPDDPDVAAWKTRRRKLLAASDPLRDDTDRRAQCCRRRSVCRRATAARKRPPRGYNNWDGEAGVWRNDEGDTPMSKKERQAQAARERRQRKRRSSVLNGRAAC